MFLPNHSHIWNSRKSLKLAQGKFDVGQGKHRKLKKKTGLVETLLCILGGSGGFRVGGGGGGREGVRPSPFCRILFF